MELSGNENGREKCVTLLMDNNTKLDFSFLFLLVNKEEGNISKTLNALLKMGYNDDALVSILHAFVTKISSTIQVIERNVVHTFGFIRLEINWNQQQS